MRLHHTCTGCSYGHIGHFGQAMCSWIRLIHDLMSLPLVSTTLAGCPVNHSTFSDHSTPGQGWGSLAQQMEPRAAPACQCLND